LRGENVNDRRALPSHCSRDGAAHRRLWIFRVFRLQAGANQHATQRPFARRAALFGRHVPVTIHYNVDGIRSRSIHGGKIGIFGQHDPAFARMLFQILLYDLLRFAHVDSQRNQSLGRELIRHIVDQRLPASAARTPRRPKLEQYNFAFYPIIGELRAAESFGVKAWRRLRLVALGDRKRAHENNCQ